MNLLDAEVGEEKLSGICDNRFGQSLAVHRNHAHRARMLHSMHLAAQGLEQDDDARAFHTASGRAGAGTYQHKTQQNAFAEYGPDIKICGGKACGGDYGENLERGVSQGCTKGAVDAAYIDGDECDGCKNNAQEEYQLAVKKCALELTR